VQFENAQLAFPTSEGIHGEAERGISNLKTILNLNDEERVRMLSFCLLRSKCVCNN
jgi:hypothetical protein